MLLPVFFRYLGKEADTDADLCFTKKRKNTKALQTPSQQSCDYLPVSFQNMHQASLIY